MTQRHLHSELGRVRNKRSLKAHSLRPAGEVSHPRRGVNSLSRDTSNVFSTPVVLVLTWSECVYCRLGGTGGGQASGLLVGPSGPVQFKVEPDAGGFLVGFSLVL